jgi:PA domain
MRRTILALVLLASLPAFAGTGKIIIVNGDGAGVGFNDPTPVLPVGGNPGTTLGEQRLNVFRAAAEAWSLVLDTNVDIIAQATFPVIPGGCTNDSAILGQAAPWSWQRDFTNAPKARVWYPIALANALSGRDLSPGSPDIFVQFNSALDTPTCFGDSGWYYGLDRNKGGHTDLYVVVLHELGHGLGIAGNGRAPVFREGIPAITDVHTLDLTTGQRWDQMSETQRLESLTNTGNLVWDGDNVRHNAFRFLQPVTTLTVTEPSAVARNYDIGTAAFGAVASNTFMTGEIVKALDTITVDSPSTTDGCTPFTNADAVAGKIALVDRGNCFFVEKARNAQAAGAIGLIVVDNTRDTCQPPPMGGGTGDNSDITIPVISITQDDGGLLRTVDGARGTLRNDPSQLAGTKQNFARLYAPCTDEPGSSLHHWDVVATPNLLMEPSVNGDLLHGLDLTLYQLLDIGWKLPPKSGRRSYNR